MLGLELIGIALGLTLSLLGCMMFIIDNEVRLDK